MSIYMLTSRFINGFNNEISAYMNKSIIKRDIFVYIASDFQNYKITDKYFKEILDMFSQININFKYPYVIDSRLSRDKANQIVKRSDLIWLSGGDTPTQFKSLKEYHLLSTIKNHKSPVIGMSAGAINMAEVSICSLNCGHDKQEIYEGLGCVNISVEPHYNSGIVSKELVELSLDHDIYGLCDESMIAVNDNQVLYFGEVYKISKGIIQKVR